MSEQKGILGFLEKRLNHPFMGTFVLAFVIYNYDVLIIFNYGLESGFTELAIQEYKGNFETWYFNKRILIPAMIMIGYTILLPWFDIGYSWFLKFIESVKTNWLERGKKVEREYKIQSLSVELNDLRIERANLKKGIEYLKEYILKTKDSEDQYLVARSDGSCKMNDLVSLDVITATVSVLNVKNYQSFIGKVIGQLRANVLCIELLNDKDCYLQYDLYEKFANKQVFWNPQLKEFLSENFEGRSVELGHVKKLPSGKFENSQILPFKPSREEKQKVFNLVLAEELCR